MKVMVVEDEAITAMSLEQDLRELGHVVCGRAASGEQALDCARTTDPALIFMDIRLAGNVDGIDTAKEILSRQHTSIVFMTGYHNRDVKPRAMALRPVAFLKKPIYQDSIKKVIFKAMTHNQL